MMTALAATSVSCDIQNAKPYAIGLWAVPMKKKRSGATARWRGLPPKLAGKHLQRSVDHVEAPAHQISCGLKLPGRAECTMASWAGPSAMAP